MSEYVLHVSFWVWESQVLNHNSENRLRTPVGLLLPPWHTILNYNGLTTAVLYSSLVPRAEERIHFLPSSYPLYQLLIEIKNKL